jgi:MtN3 and saliva related transmembrane protein
VSIITFLGFCGIQIFTILHGYIKKDLILMWGYIFSLVTCGTATYLMIYYRSKRLNC